MCEGGGGDKAFSRRRRHVVEANRKFRFTNTIRRPGCPRAVAARGTAAPVHAVKGVRLIEAAQGACNVLVLADHRLLHARKPDNQADHQDGSHHDQFSGQHETRVVVPELLPEASHREYSLRFGSNGWQRASVAATGVTPWPPWVFGGTACPCMVDSQVDCVIDSLRTPARWPDAVRRLPFFLKINEAIPSIQVRRSLRIRESAQLIPAAGDWESPRSMFST